VGSHICSDVLIGTPWRLFDNRKILNSYILNRFRVIIYLLLHWHHNTASCWIFFEIETIHDTPWWRHELTHSAYQQNGYSRGHEKPGLSDPSVPKTGTKSKQMHPE
jgi:hypothetical protein